MTKDLSSPCSLGRRAGQVAFPSRCSPAEFAVYACFLRLLIEIRHSRFETCASPARISRFDLRVSIFQDCEAPASGVWFFFQPPASSLQLPELPGGLTARVTPVPISNTEVKPRRADDTARVTARERRSPPGLFFKRPHSPKGGRGLFLLRPGCVGSLCYTFSQGDLL